MAGYDPALRAGLRRATSSTGSERLAFSLTPDPLPRFAKATLGKPWERVKRADAVRPYPGDLPFGLAHGPERRRGAGRRYNGSVWA